MLWAFGPAIIEVVSRDLQDLLNDASRGDSATLDELVARYLPRLHAYVRVHMGPQLRAREASVDLVQSICREALEERGEFEFRGEGPFLRWLLTAAMNKLRERARFHARQRRDHKREELLHDGGAYTALSPSQEAMGHEEIERLEAVLDQLSHDHREVIVLARIVHLPHADIAEQMGRSVSAVRKLLARALAKLGRELGGAAR